MKLRLTFFVFVFLHIHFLWGQELVLPPRISVLQQYTSFGPVSINVRVWGWSSNGTVAISTEYSVVEGGQSINFLILDLNSNDALFQLWLNSFLAGDIEIMDEALYNANSTAIVDALQTHSIIKQETAFLQFPMTRNETVYDASIIDIEFEEDSLGDYSIATYAIVVTANDRRTVIDNIRPFRADSVFIRGYFLSPVENRIVIVITELSGFQHGPRRLRFVGSYLGS